jgi:elongation factor Ts
MFVTADEVPQEALDKEREIFAAQARDSGKPEEVIEKMVKGKLQKYLNEVTLVGQPFVKDPDQTVAKLVKNEQASILGFRRLEVGEGIEKREDDFVAEVMAQAKGE